MGDSARRSEVWCFTYREDEPARIGSTTVIDRACSRALERVAGRNERSNTGQLETRRPWRVQANLGFRTLLLVAAVATGVIVLIGIAQALLLVAGGIFLAFVFEFPLRLLMDKTKLKRGLAATILVLGSAVT